MTDRAIGSNRFRRPESVLVIIHTRALECLLLERVEPAGFWQSVTGALHWEETFGDAAAREVREETGLEPAGLSDSGVTHRFPLLPQWGSRYAPGVEENTEYLWYLEFPEPQIVTLNPAEHRACRWFSLDDAIKAATSWTNREGLERLDRGRKKS